MSDLISRQAAIDALKNDMASLDHIIQGMSGYDVRLDAYVSQRNQVNCDIDTISNLPPAQPEPCEDAVSRKAVIDAIDEWKEACADSGHKETVSDIKLIRKDFIELPPVTPKQPEQHIDADGTLWITVPDIERVTRVIVDEEKSKFCRQFYMEEEQRTGKWIPSDSQCGIRCSACGAPVDDFCHSIDYIDLVYEPNYLRMELIQGQLNDIEENVRSIKATWGNTIMTLDNIKSSLKADRQKAIEEAYQKGFEAGQHEATTLEYQQGLNDAWECARKISLVSPDEIEKVFPGAAKYNRYNLGYSGTEAIEKLKAYEQQKADEIKVGDEVCFVFAGGETIEPFIVFSIKDDNGKKYYEGIQTSDGRWVSGGLKYYKTGRHFPHVAELLEAMKGGAE